MAAAKYLDAIGHFPGHISEDSDAVGAYRQVFLDELDDLLGNSKEFQAQTWITLPRSRRPTWWDEIEDPVCLLKRNVYGHPIAGLIWEKFCQKQLKKLGFELVPGWECLFVQK